MGIKRKFTGILELGHGADSIKIESYGKNVRIEIVQKEWSEETATMLWIDVKTAVQLSKELRNVISQCKSKENL